MIFKSLKNIQTSFEQIRLFVIIYTCICTIISGFSIWSSYNYAEKQREKIYVLDNGKSLMLALSQDIEQNRPVEVREHIRLFHELFFTLTPDKEAIDSNIKRALLLVDRSGYNYYNDIAEKDYYKRIISGNIIQNIKIDSIVCDFNTYPYKATTYATQKIIRESNITERKMITKCNIINSIKSNNNPYGCQMERFEIIENPDVRVIER